MEQQNYTTGDDGAPQQVEAPKKSTRKRYPAHFKRRVAQQAIKEKMTHQQAADAFGVSSFSVGEWIKEEKQRQRQASESAKRQSEIAQKVKQEKDECRLLREKNAELTKEVARLKDVVSELLFDLWMKSK